MASVSVVSSSEFRANLTQPQNAAPEGDEPFSLLLNSVADVKASVQRPDAPKVAERNDVPSKQQKPETNTDRQAKRRAPDAEKPEAKPQSEATAPAKPADDDAEETESEDKGDDTTAVDALLMIALNGQQQTAAPVIVGADVDAEAIATPVVAVEAAAAVETQTTPAPALAPAAAIADATQAASAEMQSVPVAQANPKTTIQLEVSPQAANGKSFELSLPQVAADAILSKSKPENAAAQFKLEVQAQAQTQPGSVNVATATPVQGPAPLEMLNAAISKHVQLSLGADAADQPLDVQKPLISSNAIAPNFAMTAQVNAPVSIQTQQTADPSRAVPLDQLAVEIATRAGKGERRFDIRLDPPELGRIDVRLEIDSKGNTTTKLIVERSETLDMLQRDARGLEKALQNAGLKTDAGSMQFSLSQDTQTQHDQQNHAPEMRGRLDPLQADAEVMTEVSINNATLAAQLRGGVDIRI